MSVFSQTCFPSAATVAGTGLLQSSYGWWGQAQIYTENGGVAPANCASMTGMTPANWSQDLLASGFGFTIPTGATIVGVAFDYKGYAYAGNSPVIKDYRVELYTGASVIGANKVYTTNNSQLSTSALTWRSAQGVLYGSAYDLWGATLTPAIVNNSNFGVGLSLMCSSGSGTVSAAIDVVKLIVYYDDNIVPPETIINSAKFATVGANDSTVGAYGWSSTNYVGTSGTNYANIGGAAAGKIVQYLKGTGFGFSIPSNAIIKGITFNFIGYAGSANTAHDYSIKLVKGGVISGDNKASSVIWQTTTGIYRGAQGAHYGGQYDLWGLNLTPADVNNSNFGVVVAAGLDSGGTNGMNADGFNLQVSYVIPYTFNVSKFFQFF